MCAVSIIGDNYGGGYWPQRFPKTFPGPSIPNQISIPSQVSALEFESLKKEVQELKKLLLAAKSFDAATGQQDCEIEEKVLLLKKIAELVGIDLDEVFGSGKE